MICVHVLDDSLTRGFVGGLRRFHNALVSWDELSVSLSG
jgi:hypothetical protein